MLAAAPLASVAGVVATPALVQAQVVDVVKDDFKGLDSAEIAIDTSKIRLQDAEDATGEMSPQDMSYDVAANLTANAFTREGWKFLGWKDNDGNLYTDMQEVINLIAENGGKVTLYAQWEREPVTPTQATPTETPTSTTSTSTVSAMPNTGSENVVPVVGGGFAAIATGLSRLFKKKREE